MTTRHALTNALLLVFSIAVALVAAEVLFRTIDGYRLDRLTLAAVLGHGEQPAKASLPDARKRTFAKARVRSRDGTTSISNSSSTRNSTTTAQRLSWARPAILTASM